MRRVYHSLVTCLLVLGVSSSALAADHKDSPAAETNGVTDITDVFAWANADGTKTNLILNVRADSAEAVFSDAAQYVFHVSSSANYGAMESQQTTIMCTFAADATIQCWAGDDYVTGDASDVAGLVSDSGSLKVFAGQRNDPFFLPFEGFTAVVGAVIEAAGSLMFDEAGCPALDDATAAALGTLLSTDENEMQRADTFANSNVLSLAVQVDTSLINAGGPVLAVWASTRRAAE
jgi:hypothetical protein